jgi:(p)ppGpp synthase/HD superfamily hydrolase
MSTLERAVEIAAKAHAGQIDKAGAPYILHPLRVMLRMRTTEERIVAVLHDVVEDTEWTLDGLRGEGFSDEVIDAVASVTKGDGETYEEFIERAAQNAIGRRVKRAGLIENSDMSRIRNLKKGDGERLKKYERGLQFLDDWERRMTP